MPEATDLATAIATEVAKQIPVRDAYDDAVKPAARQVGIIAEDLTKTILLVLAPLQLTGALQDRFRDFLDRSVRRVPEENRVTPPPQILGPVLEGIRYEPENSPIADMFSNLLSASIDQTRAHSAHPAFSQIIKHLSGDEATLLNAMWTLWKQEGRFFRQQFTQDYDRESATFSNTKMELDEIPRENFIFPENVEFYGQHLYALGITAFFDSAGQEPIWSDGSSGDGRETYTKVQIGTRIFKELRFTDVGRKFMEAVCS